MAALTGPIIGGARDWPFGASVQGLDAVGYVEEEFFLEGDATLFSLVPDAEYTFDGRWPVEVRDKVPFRTRLLVRRPVDPERFNGVVVVNWNNVSRGFEFLWDLGDLVDSGAAWVGVSTQRVGLYGLPFGTPLGLTMLDPVRYGELSIPDDDASFDIFTQAARAIGPDRVTTGVDPMGGLRVEKLLAFGSSQSGSRLATYYNAIQPVSGVFDGFLLVVYPGGGTRVDATGPGPSLPEIPEAARAIVNLLPLGSHLLRQDQPSPVLVVNSETEAGWYYTARQPATDTFRLWEVAGAAHTGARGSDDDSEAGVLRHIEEIPVLPIPADANPNTLSFRSVADAALDHLQAWVLTGAAPPPQDLIEFAGDPPAIVRDEHGNARGGIRLPDLAVPTGTHIGASSAGLANLFGSSTPFSSEVLTELYGDRAGYLARYSDAVDRGVDLGYIPARQADRLKAGADPHQLL